MTDKRIKQAIQKILAEQGKSTILTPEWTDRLRQEPRPCQNCFYAKTDRRAVRDFLAARGITQVGDDPDENTIAREFKWGPHIVNLDVLCLCTIPEKSGAMLCQVNATCPHWREDTGRIWIPVSR
jgi:hypothetical protein